MGRLVTGGEAMLAVAAETIGAIRSGDTARLTMAGSESTVAIGVRRLGHDSVWISRVGDDSAGRLILDSVRGSGVETSVAIGGGPTGLMLKERRTATTRRVQYHRSGSAASMLSEADAQSVELSHSDLIHVTGITAALSTSARGFVRALVERAVTTGSRVSVDINYRSRLWPPEEARPVLRSLVERADIVFASDDEAQLVTGSSDSGDRLVDALRSLGPRIAVVTAGAEGAWYSDGQHGRQIAMPTEEVDPFGAGDAFVAGFLAGALDGLSTEACARQAAMVAAVGVSTRGDWEGLPTSDELTSLYDPTSIAR